MLVMFNCALQSGSQNHILKNSLSSSLPRCPFQDVYCVREVSSLGFLERDRCEISTDPTGGDLTSLYKTVIWGLPRKEYVILERLQSSVKERRQSREKQDRAVCDPVWPVASPLLGFSKSRFFPCQVNLWFCSCNRKDRSTHSKHKIFISLTFI